jgi:hypothetical protein
MPGGRETLYDWEGMQPKIAEAIDKGLHVYQFARLLGVTVQTVHNWKDIHPEFFDAVKMIETSCQARIADTLDNLSEGRIEKGNASTAIFIAKNVLGWRDRQEVEQTVKGEQSITVTIGGARQDEDDAETH